LCLMWCIWRERNVRCFEDREISVVELKNIMFKSLYTRVMPLSAFKEVEILIPKKKKKEEEKVRSQKFSRNHLLGVVC
jgi:hypothetical protein